MKLAYREDIDGLRAIAVLAVVFFHAGVSLVSGGYVGVDIFFVISGYLITTIVLREADAHEFSFVKFYERRIRRIFPALFTVLPVTVILSILLFSPHEFLEFSKSLMAATFFAANIFFWAQSGYFEGPSELKPLLHTWSLAVEEQFYIVYPLVFVFLVRRFQFRLGVILLGIALASFTWDMYSLGHDPTGAFYLTHLRIWELLIGGLLAVKVIPTIVHPRLGNLLGAAGLLLTIVPIFLYTKDTSFPGFAAAVPTLGAALIIYSGMEKKTAIRRILGFGPLVFIGQISYSLYLWHWPLIIFAKYYAIVKLTPLQLSAVLLVIFILSVLSWKFVEKPFRQRTILKNRKIFPYAAGVMALALSVGAVIFWNQGFPQRLSTLQADLDPNADVQWEKWGKCEQKMCDIGKASSTPTFMVWGDSHARALLPAIQDSSSRAGATGMVAYTSGCAPLLGIDEQGQEQCDGFSAKVIGYIRNHPNLDTVILASRWALYETGARYKQEDGKRVVLTNVQGNDATDTNATVFTLGLTQTVKMLSGMGRKVVIVTQVPEVGYPVPSAFLVAQRTGRNLNKLIAPTFQEYLQRNQPVLTILDELKSRYNVQLVNPAAVMCNNDTCPVVVDGHPLYWDDHHLSTFGSLHVTSIFDPIFKEIVQPTYTQ